MMYGCETIHPSGNNGSNGIIVPQPIPLSRVSEIQVQPINEDIEQSPVVIAVTVADTVSIPVVHATPVGISSRSSSSSSHSPPVVIVSNGSSHTSVPSAVQPQQQFNFESPSSSNETQLPLDSQTIRMNAIIRNRQSNAANSSQGIVQYESLARWRDDLFSCTRQLYPSCLFSIICPCILMGEITSKIKFMPYIFAFFICLILYGLTIFLFLTKEGLPGAMLTWGFLSLFVCSVRKKIRTVTKFSLGNDAEDYANSCCCFYCVVSQMARHVMAYESSMDCGRYKLDTWRRSRHGRNNELECV